MVEVVQDECLVGGELLQTSHLADAEHRTFASSERQVRIVRAIVPPAAGNLEITRTGPER